MAESASPFRDTMAARGWTWSDEYRMFLALGGRDSQDCPVIGLRVWEVAPGAWIASYGVPGIGYGDYKRCATPIEASDAAEAWLRGVLAPFTFPWLKMGVQGG